VRHPLCLGDTDTDYLAIEDWVMGATGVINEPPTADAGLPAITMQEYAEPAEDVGPVTWSDPDGDLSQLFINRPASSEHIFNDTMLALSYLNFNSAMVKTYAILGDRGAQELEFVVSDGQRNSEIQKVPVTVTSDYVVPKPEPTLPEFSAFYTERDTGALHRIDHTGDDVVVPKRS